MYAVLIGIHIHTDHWHKSKSGIWRLHLAKFKFKAFHSWSLHSGNNSLPFNSVKPEEMSKKNKKGLQMSVYLANELSVIAVAVAVC